ncbi:hypothetical protein CERSUDRAFT_114630 [Gelatoporia subvermispora B]|uniref:Uncharacterized protein n=1 Tax=Ceriporiopsis subvermispora (strain B) TaxID=914234 RepID=M2RDZ7_CERS8|nr:hypothetical protein CERSUDRAFT_114630 [Gelatoporia subvermispora B]
MPPMWNFARTWWAGHLLDARYMPELGRALRGFVETRLDDWLRDRGASVQPIFSYVNKVDVCAKARRWYKNGSDDGLVAALDEIIDRRVKELVAEAVQSPEMFLPWELPRIKVWSTANGYMPDEEEHNQEDA